MKKRWVVLAMFVGVSLGLSFWSHKVKATDKPTSVSVALYQKEKINGETYECRMTAQIEPNEDCHTIAAYKCCVTESQEKKGGTYTLITGHPARYIFNCDGASCDEGCSDSDAAAINVESSASQMQN